MNKEMIEELEEKKKSNNQKKAILMLEGIIVLLLVVIIVLLVVPEIRKSESTVKESNTQQEDIPPKKDNSAQEDNTNKEEKVSENVQALITEKVKIVSKYLGHLYPIGDINNLNNQELLRFAQKNMPNAIVNGFTKDDVNLFLQKYFGDVSIQHENISCDFITNGKSHFDFLYNNGKYTFNNIDGNHGVCNADSHLKLVSSSKKDNIIVSDYRILYTISCFTSGPDIEYYSRLPIDSNNLALKVHEGKEPTEEEMNAAYEKAPITQFTFEVDSNGNYVLKSVSEK